MGCSELKASYLFYWQKGSLPLSQDAAGHQALCLYARLQHAEACAAAQVAFFKGFIDTAKAPPTWLRMVNKRGTFFAPLDPTRTPSASLPKLLKRCALPSHLQWRWSVLL